MGTVQFPLICLETLKTKGRELLGSDGILRTVHGELFQVMLSLGIIEYVEAWEALDYRVAFKGSDLILPVEKMEFTHMALHPMAFLGTSASTVPWSDHDQAPRVSYQAGMLKQAISCPATNLAARFDQNYAYTLWYPQKPLADTVVSESRKLQEWPMGENLLIAIASYEGLSQEDAIVRNNAAIQRGSGRITVHRVYRAVIHKLSSTDYEAFECPQQVLCGVACIGIRAECDYSKLDVSGLPTEGTHVRNGDIIIGRVIYTSDDSGNRVRRDRSIILTCEESEAYIIDKILITTNRDGLRQVRVRVRTMRTPQAGDKISDRHGQKGVIGFLANQEDMPFVADGPNAGMVPDAIVNLHSINGRMTLGKLLEMLYSNVSLTSGYFADASPFRNLDAQWALNQLRKSGYGTEVRMMNGKTGEMMTTPWFLGSCFYQSLKHMVLDKITARNRGPRATLTRQPMEGRAKQGGLRVGEMERDAFLAHGASMILDDRSRVASDGHVAPVCTGCGQIGEMATAFKLNELLNIDRKDSCRICGGRIQIINTTYCYSSLLVRELATAGIKIEHKFEDNLASNLEDMEL
jgi:DNA-directed RNA polymerase II subunit RPB2